MFLCLITRSKRISLPVVHREYWSGAIFITGKERLKWGRQVCIKMWFAYLGGDPLSGQKDWHKSQCFKMLQAVQNHLWSLRAIWCLFWGQNSTATSANSSQGSQSHYPTRKPRFVQPTSLKTEQHNHLSPKCSHNSSSGTWTMLGTKHTSTNKCKIFLWIKWLLLRTFRLWAQPKGPVHTPEGEQHSPVLVLITLHLVLMSPKPQLSKT